MVDVSIRLNEGCDPQPQLLWDSVWSVAAGQADWAIAGAGEALNRGGLQATQALRTAVILCLFTDRRLPDDHPLRRFVDGDPGGWWGDGVDVRTDLGEHEMGSYLHALERATVGADTARWAREIAAEALLPLRAQGAVARIDVDAQADPVNRRLDLAVRLYGRDGAVVFDERFDDLWRQEAA